MNYIRQKYKNKLTRQGDCCIQIYKTLNEYWYTIALSVLMNL